MRGIVSQGGKRGLRAFEGGLRGAASFQAVWVPSADGRTREFFSSPSSADESKVASFRRYEERQPCHPTEMGGALSFRPPIGRSASTFSKLLPRDRHSRIVSSREALARSELASSAWLPLKNEARYAVGVAAQHGDRFAGEQFPFSPRLRRRERRAARTPGANAICEAREPDSAPSGRRARPPSPSAGE